MPPPERVRPPVDSLRLLWQGPGDVGVWGVLVRVGPGWVSGCGSALWPGGRLIGVVLEGDAPGQVGAYGGGMGKTVLTILGVILAVWLVMTVIGAILSMLKFFFFIGLIAVVVVLAVTAVSKMSKSN